jgi:hypothetical protein
VTLRYRIRRVERAFEGESAVVPDPTIIVREPDLPRIAAATRAVLGELGRPRPAGQWASEYLAPMLANRALDADDDHGREHGLVIQADELRWPELEALAETVKAVLDFDRHMTTNAVHAECLQCTAIQAYRRIANYSRYRTVGPHTPLPKRAQLSSLPGP